LDNVSKQQNRQTPSYNDSVNVVSLLLIPGMGSEAEKWMAAPAETETPSLHRAHQAHSIVRMEGRRQFKTRPGKELTMAIYQHSGQIQPSLFNMFLVYPMPGLIPPCIG
jgi:hypothetical protein